MSTPHDQMLVWDLADNLIAIEDLRDPTEWPDGFRPQSVAVTHDSLYRVAGAEYEYTSDTGGRTPIDDTSASNDWRSEMAIGRPNDPMRTAPAPIVSDEPDQRVVSMTWEHDWLGNMQSWDDDNAVFYERSLGEIVNGADLPSEAPSRRTGALYVASNLPSTPVTADDGGWVEVRYGEDGNALAVTVHGRCGDPDENEIELDCRTGTDDPEEAVDLSCAYSCATEQHFTYAWDEVNRIAHARRLDREDGGDWELAVEQRYLYDANNQRTVKTTTFRGIESGTERTALYIYPGDFERRGLELSSEFSTLGPGRYEAVAGDTETQYGVGGARIVWRTSDRDETLDRDQRITISLTDLIQSTTAVIDLATGELVEAGSFYANGARETYRSNETETVTPEPMGFTGKEADEEVGLTYFGVRYLIAHLGRWASPDPLQTHAVDGGEAINGYHYISGNLLQARDPVGLQEAAAQPAAPAAGDPAEAAAAIQAVRADARFQALPDDLTRATVEMAVQGGQRDFDAIFGAANFAPAEDSGVRISGPATAQFMQVLRRAMIIDPAFRAEVIAQAGRQQAPIRISATTNSGPQGQPTTVDFARATLPAPGPWGSHVIDMDDVNAFPALAGQLPYASATTAEQNVVHVVAEAMDAVQRLGSATAQGTQVQRIRQWAPSHNVTALAAENRLRRAAGQPGQLVGSRAMTPSGLVMRFGYRGGPDEIITFNRQGGVLGILRARGEDQAQQ
ncbi:MAG: hypothetical protein J0L92_03070 [Deltaproteobacteria bacterium]|nr:hypothetical protein [Deltaproteobacteria bacterium]